MSGASADAAPATHRPRRNADKRPRDDASAEARRARKEARLAAGGAAKDSGRRVDRFARRGRNYGRTIAWAVRDSFAARPPRLILALLLGGLGLGAQAVAVLVVVGYGQAMQQDGGVVIPFLGIDWTARTDTALLLAVVGAFAASLSAAALLNFASNGLLLSIVRQSLARNVERFARAARSLPDPRAPRASRIFVDFGTRTINGGATSVGRGAFMIVQTIPALFGAVLATGVLFWLEPVLTAVLLAATVLWSALLYPISLRVVGFGRRLGRANAAIRNQHTRIADTNWAPAGELATAYTGWLRTRAEIVVVVGIGIAVIVAIAISVMGTEIMHGAQDWPVLIAYVGALQVALNGVFRTIRAVAIVSRRYPEIARSRQFVLDIGGLARPTASPRTGETVTLARAVGGEPFHATVGERLAVLSGEPLQKIQLLSLAATDAGGTPVRSARWARGSHAATIDEATILFIDSRVLASDDVAGRPFTDRLMIVVHPEPATVGRFGESRLVVLDGDAVARSAVVGSAEAATILAQAVKRAARAEERRRDSFSDDDEDLQ